MEQLSKKALASRANGAKSKGPKTEAGKRRSSANSIRHGLLAKSIVLCNESDSAFQQFFDEHLHKLNPADGVEYAIVEEIAAAAWRLRRIWYIESTLFNKAIRRSTDPSEAGRTSEAFASLAGSNQLQLLDRYESRLHRMYQRSLKTFEQLQKLPQVQPNPEPDEPNIDPSEIPEPALPNKPGPASTGPINANTASDPTEPPSSEETQSEVQQEAESKPKSKVDAVADQSATAANLPNEPKPLTSHNRSHISYEVRPGQINGLPTRR